MEAVLPVSYMVFLSHYVDYYDLLIYDDGAGDAGDGDYPTQETLVFWKGLQSKI